MKKLGRIEINLINLKMFGGGFPFEEFAGMHGHGHGRAK